MHIKANDMVEITRGEDRGTRAKVVKVDRATNKILVEGVNRVYKHLRRSQKNPQGGRLSKEMPISLSNVLLVCPACGKATRTGARYRNDGTKERFCKKCNKEISIVAGARAAYAKK